MRSASQALLKAASKLRKDVSAFRFPEPVTHVYNPLDYAWAVHRAYIETYGATRKQIVFLGMNPGPFGMVQTGVPFGEIGAVRDWMKLKARVAKPAREHPKRPIHGFDCTRSEVSGRRLWGLFAERFGSARSFFKSHFVVNFCPLAFLEASGRNVTPDKLPPARRESLFEACNAHLERVLEILEPKWVIGVGDFAEKRLRELPRADAFKTGRVLHPSPASPAANRGWSETATKQLLTLGAW